jgi:hypothetical protein
MEAHRFADLRYIHRKQPSGSMLSNCGANRISTDDRKERGKKYATATKIKTLLETPEHIWTALSREKHLEATLLYHQAQLLHAKLRTDPESCAVMETMPIAPRQWSVICQFPPKIATASKEFLARPDQSPEQYPFNWGAQEERTRGESARREHEERW